MAAIPMEGELGRAPKLSRLLTPEETLIYTVRFHPLRGWPVLLLALAAGVAAYWEILMLVPAVMLAGLWYLPIYTNEVAVTDDRLLLRTGWMSLLLEAIEDQNLLRWELSQGAIGSMLDFGTVRIRVREAASTREIVLKWVWHPVTLLEALQAMQDERYRDAT